jgi:hypothetical protein
LWKGAEEMGKKRKQYYWNPFGVGADTTLDTNGAYFRQKSNCTVVFMDGGGFLGSVPDDAVLLIDGHGGGLPKISDKANNGNSYDYKTIAYWIKEWGHLPATHLLIKFVGCQTSFCAQCLAKELGTTHKNLVVGGYTHSVVHGTGTRAFILTGGEKLGVRNTTNSGFVKWYGIDGKETKKLDLPKYDFED